MAELAFRDGVMDRIRIRESRYDEQAYLFVLSALEYAQAKLDARRHITRHELAHACRELALERYGLMARIVLERWGIPPPPTSAKSSSHSSTSAFLSS